jgi:hypothetical protein
MLQDDQQEAQNVESSFADLGHLNARKLSNGRLDWNGFIMPVALKLIASRRSHVYAARVLRVNAGELFMKLNDEHWAPKYTRAMVERAANVAELAMDTVERTDLDPNDKRVRVDTYKWFAARMDPKRWGDRLPLPDAEAEHQRQMASLGTDAARLAFAAIAASLGMQMQPAALPAIQGEATRVDKPDA